MTIIWCDGGASANGTANVKCYGSFLVEGEELPHRLDFPEGTTNNQAEYLSLISTLSYCKEKGIKKPIIRMDSLLIVNQTTEKWRVKEQGLRSFNDKAKLLLKQTGAMMEWIDNKSMKRILGH